MDLAPAIPGLASLTLGYVRHCKKGGEGIWRNENVKKIFNIIQAQPGICYADILRELEIGNGTLQYHLDRLEKGKWVSTVRDGKYKRCFPKGQKPNETEENTQHNKIMLYLFNNPGANQTEIATNLDLTKQTINTQIRKLVREGKVNSKRDGKSTVNKLSRRMQILYQAKHLKD